MEDLEGYAGLKRTKGGSNDTEPAYVVRRKSCWRWVAIAGLSLTVAFLWVWRSETLLRKLSPRLAARRKAARKTQHAAHAKITALGAELERHLEEDMKERETAMKLRAKLRDIQRVHRANVTRALDAAAIGTDAFTFESRDAVMPYVDSAIDALFDDLRHTLEHRIVAPMLSSGSAAYERHKKLHDEILAELRRDREERTAFLDKNRNARGDLDGDGLVEDRDYDGERDVNWDDGWDDENAKHRDEEWRRDMIDNFEEAFHNHFNDSYAAEHGFQPRNLLTTNDPLFHTLSDLEKRLGFHEDYVDPSSNASAPSLHWRDAEKELQQLKPHLDKHRCHAFEPSSPPADDEFDYVQLHNVENYLSEALWNAKLNTFRDRIQSILDDLHHNVIPSLEAVEALETAQGDGLFPSFWLYHPHLDDYRYGDW